MALNDREIQGLEKLKRKLRLAAEALQGRARVNAVRRSGAVLVGEMKRQVTGVGTRTKVGVRTGRLRQSIHQKSEAAGFNTRVIVGAKYGRILARGGRIPPHIIRARRVKALRFFWGKRFQDYEVFFKSVQHPGAIIGARGYDTIAFRRARPTMISIIRQVYAGPLKFQGRGGFVV